MEAQKLGVYRETAPGEQRVALLPASVRNVRARGLAVWVETGAGARVGISDGHYARAGAGIVTRDQLFTAADVLVGARAPNVPLDHRFRDGQILICLLEPLRTPGLTWHWANQGLTTVAMDLLPPGFAVTPPLTATSAGYAGAVVALLEHLVRDGVLVIDLEDSLTAAIVVTHHREVLHDETWRRIRAEIALAGLP